MKIRGPLVTLGRRCGPGRRHIDRQHFQGAEPAPPGKPVAESTTTTAPATPLRATAPTTPPAPAFPAKADYVGKIPTANGTITLEITVEGDKAVAYACDGNTIESWLRGPAVNGTVSLANKDKTSRLEGRLDGTAVVGTLWIGEKKWDFTRSPRSRPPGCMSTRRRRPQQLDHRLDRRGDRRAAADDGSTVPAPGLETDGIAVIDGRAVTATRVQGGSDV